MEDNNERPLFHEDSHGQTSQIFRQAKFDRFVLQRLSTLRRLDRSHGKLNSESGGTMRTTVMDLYRQEARRQVTVGLEIVEGAMATPTLVPEAATDGGVDIASLKNLRETLQQEIVKLDRNEATVAVIGAMKSGKSTSINAIVGSEIVPSRDKPMTTFPTIVSHVRGTVAPRLEFQLSRAFLRLAADIRAVLDEDPEKADERLASAGSGKDLVALAEKIRAGELALGENAIGYEEIRRLLIEVNDLTRLADVFAISKSVIDEELTFLTIPRIEVEFEHLADLENATGTLSLVDTPGPDEARDSRRLESIAREQLHRASAIILVVNYRLIGGEASEGIQELLTLLPEGAEERLFVFINQYDQRSEEGAYDDEEAFLAGEALRLDQAKAAIASQVYGRLTGDGQSGLDRVYAVSARQALLANQARRAVRLDGKLPQSSAWARQFAKEVGAVFSRSFSPPPSFSDRNGIAEGATALWNESLYPEPLAQVISTSARNATTILVHSCLDKLKGGEMARLFELLKIQMGAFGAKTEALKTLVGNLTHDLSLLDTAQRTSVRHIESLSGQSETVIAAYIDEAMGNIEEVLHAYLVMEATEAEKRSRNLWEGTKQRGKQLRQRLRGFSRKQSPSSTAQSDWEARADRSSVARVAALNRVPVATAEEARSKANKLYSAVEKEFASASTALMEWVHGALSEISGDAKETVDETFSQGWSHVRDHISEILNVTIDQPAIEVSFSDAVMFERYARERGATSSRHNVTVSVAREGIAAGAKRFFGDLFNAFGANTTHWGREERVETRTDHYVDMQAIRAEMEKKSHLLETEMRAAVEAYLKALQESLDDYGLVVRQKVEQIHRYISEERSRREGDAEAYGALRDTVASLAAQAGDLTTEALALRKGTGHE